MSDDRAWGLMLRAVELCRELERVLAELTAGMLEAPDALPLEDLAVAGVRTVGRRPDGFYARVLEAVARCERAQVPYAQRIALANGVSTSAVYRWVQEARRRRLAGLTPP